MLIAGLTTNVEELHQHIAAMQEQIRVLREQLFLATRQQFGRSSEAFPAEQQWLFNTPDTEIVLVDDERDVANDAPNPGRKKRQVRQAVVVAKDTPVERVELDLAEHDKVCGGCAGVLHNIGEDCTRQVEYIPHQVRVIETVRPKYACRRCETGVQQQALPPSLLPKSMATPSLLAFLIVSKFLDHQPLNRLEQMLKRAGITLPRSTQSDWLMACADRLKPLMALMKQDLLTSPQIFTDDTILPLQHSRKDRHRLIQARLWVYATQCKTGPPMVLYDFTTTRAKAGPQTFLKGYGGYLQADAYAGYDGLYERGAKEVACLAHCRRKLFEAAQLEETPGVAHQAVALIGELYAIEREIKHYTHKKRKKHRRRYAKPKLKKLRRWLEHQVRGHLPKGKFATAVGYALNHWDALSRYCEAGYLEIDNNYSEREMRPIALGRKNYLFTGSVRGGEAAAIWYSLVESAKANRLNVYEYVADILRRLPMLPATDKDALTPLLPYHWQPQSNHTLHGNARRDSTSTRKAA